MDKEYLYNSLYTYFNTLKNYGYKNYNSAINVLFYILFDKYMEKDFKHLVSDKDRKKWKEYSICLYGSDCMFPYPEVCEK